MQWRWTSTPLSADRGEISALAIIESVIATFISFWIAWQYQTVVHIAVSACVAPFLLLRTKKSTILGIISYEKIARSFAEKFFTVNKDFSIFLYFPMIISISFLSIFSRIVSTGRYLFMMPVYTINNIPRNWKRIVFCVDLHHPPEALPGIERIKGREIVLARRIAITKFYKQVKSEPIVNWKNDDMAQIILKPLFAIVAFIFVNSIVYFPSLLYRWSLKSTSLIWSPLLWIISSARKSGLPRVQLESICEFAMYKVMRVFSIFVAVAFLWKIFLLLNWYKIEEYVGDAPWGDVAMRYIAPDQLPLWQLAGGINAVLAWLLYLWADAQLKAIRFDHPNRTAEATITWQLATITVIRNTFALYTAACTLYITVSIATNFRWPPIEIILLPTAL